MLITSLVDRQYHHFSGFRDVEVSGLESIVNGTGWPRCSDLMPASSGVGSGQSLSGNHISPGLNRDVYSAIRVMLYSNIELSEVKRGRFSSTIQLSKRCVHNCCPLASGDGLLRALGGHEADASPGGRCDY